VDEWRVGGGRRGGKREGKGGKSGEGEEEKGKDKGMEKERAKEICGASTSPLWGGLKMRNSAFVYPLYPVLGEKKEKILT